jgi:hypothetical protein
MRGQCRRIDDGGGAKALKKPEKWPFVEARRAMRRAASSGRTQISSQSATCRDVGAVCSCLWSTGRKKACRICQKVHIKIKTKSNQSETYEEVRKPHSKIPILTIRSFPV